MLMRVWSCSQVAVVTPCRWTYTLMMFCGSIMATITRVSRQTYVVDVLNLDIDVQLRDRLTFIADFVFSWNVSDGSGTGRQHCSLRFLWSVFTLKNMWGLEFFLLTPRTSTFSAELSLRCSVTTPASSLTRSWSPVLRRRCRSPEMVNSLGGRVTVGDTWDLALHHR